MDAQLLKALIGQLSLGGPRLTYGDDPAAVLFQGRPDLARLTPPLLYSLPHHLLFLELEGLFSTRAFLQLPPVLCHRVAYYLSLWHWHHARSSLGGTRLPFLRQLKPVHSSVNGSSPVFLPTWTLQISTSQSRPDSWSILPQPSLHGEIDIVDQGAWDRTTNLGDKLTILCSRGMSWILVCCCGSFADKVTRPGSEELPGDPSQPQRSLRLKTQNPCLNFGLQQSFSPISVFGLHYVKKPNEVNIPNIRILGPLQFSPFSSSASAFWAQPVLGSDCVPSVVSYLLLARVTSRWGL